MFGQDIFSLQDDGLDGSHEELRISQEIFYGNSKKIETLPCSNSENSAVTIQASSEDLSQKDPDHAEKYRDSQSRTSLEMPFKDESIVRDLQAKRIKLSINELSSFKPILDDAVASSVPLKQVVYGINYSTPHPSRKILMCHVVESSSDGVTSSCYLLQKDLESDGSEVKQIAGCKSMASPTFQESFVTKLLVSKSPRLPKKRKKIATSSNGKDEKIKLGGNTMKHLSSRLRSEVYRLFEITGWYHEKQIRNDGRNRFLYRSPKGKCFRALSKVWYSVGDALLAHNNWKMMEEDKQWTDYKKFCSELYDTLKYIESKKDEWKTRCALSCMWKLLDPFVNVVLLNRKIISLRNGNLVKASQTNECQKDNEAGVENKENSENCVVNASEVETVENKQDSGNCANVNVDKTGDEIICESSVTFDSRESQKVKSIYVSEGDDMCLVKTIDNDEQHSLGTLTDKNVNTSSDQVSADVFDKSDMCLVKTIDNDEQHVLETPTDKNVNISSDQLSADVSDKSDKFSEIELCELCQVEAGTILSRDDYHSYLVDQIWSKQLTKKGKRLKKKSRLKKSNGVCLGEPKKRGRPKKLDNVKKSNGSHLNDHDLLVSAVIKTRSFRCGKNKLGPKARKFKSKNTKKRKSKKGGCRLRLRGVEKVTEDFTDRWTMTSERTILSWLISIGNLSVNEAIQYRDPKDDSVVKDGVITKEGISCKCCNEVLSISGFKIHAGFNQNRPCLNLFTGSGRPYTLSQLEAWSGEYKARKSGMQSVSIEEYDKNDDSCGVCGDVGELLCCDNCPSTFHQACLSAEELPEGSWYCAKCTCQVCGQLADVNESSSFRVPLKCSQCEKKFHQACLTEMDVDRNGGVPWYCGVSCAEVDIGLQSCIGLSKQIDDGFSWTLLKCIHDDQKVSSPQRLALKAECNSKLAVAATIMEECFLSMIDPRTGIDMIPQVVYNWGSEFARLDYHGFYTAVLEKNDTLISIASLRVHGVALAEMPLIATCSKYRRQGMCRRLLTSVEKMLISLKVEKLVIAAVPDLVETWTVGFGFILMDEDEKRSLNKTNLMVFPGTIILKKTLSANTDTNAQRDESHKCGEVAEESELLKGSCSSEPEYVKTNVDVSRQGNEVSEKDSDGVCLAVSVFDSESKLGEDQSQHVTENQENDAEVSEEEQKNPETSPKFEIVHETSINEAELVIEDSSITNHASNHHLGNGFNEVKEGMTNDSVGPDEASQEMKNEGESKTTENGTSKVSESKETGANGQSINIWEYWEECVVGELEPLDDRCRYDEEIIVGKEKVCNGESECIINVVGKNQLSVIKESQEGNTVPYVDTSKFVTTSVRTWSNLRHVPYFPTTTFRLSRRRLHTITAEKKERVVVISGPTGAGKTRLAIELAKRLNGEIISADSVQVYQGLNVGSAKPTISERKEVPHRLLDILHPSEEYSVGRFYDDARQATRDVLDRGRVPIITGGTGLYLRWFVYGKPDVPIASPEIASQVYAELENYQRTEDWDAAVEFVVAAGDPKAKSFPTNNWYRLRRRLEIIKSSGLPPSAFQLPYDSFKGQLDLAAPSKSEGDEVQEEKSKELDYDFMCFFLSSPRLDLYRSIDYRCEDMLSGSDGILAEAKWLLDIGLLPNSNSATKAIGYRQAMEYLLRCGERGGQSSANELFLLLSDFQKASRNFAKRQLTWFRNEPIYHWLDAAKPMDKVLDFVHDAYHDQSQTVTVPDWLKMKKDVTSHRDTAALKAYRTKNRHFVSREDCADIIKWIREAYVDERQSCSNTL